MYSGGYKCKYSFKTQDSNFNIVRLLNEANRYQFGSLDYALVENKHAEIVTFLIRNLRITEKYVIDSLRRTCKGQRYMQILKQIAEFQIGKGTSVEYLQKYVQIQIDNASNSSKPMWDQLLDDIAHLRGIHQQQQHSIVDLT